MFKEAIHKMPRQFAPQSLYNMMGKSREGSLVLLFSGRCRWRGASEDKIFTNCTTAAVVVGQLCLDAHDRHSTSLGEFLPLNHGKPKSRVAELI